MKLYKACVSSSLTSCMNAGKLLNFFSLSFYVYNMRLIAPSSGDVFSSGSLWGKIN